MTHFPRIEGHATQQANGFLVAYTCGEGIFSHYYTAEWDDALDSYSMPPMGWHSVGLSACRDGVPFCRLDAPTICQIVRPQPKVRA